MNKKINIKKALLLNKNEIYFSINNDIDTIANVLKNNIKIIILAQYKQNDKYFLSEANKIRQLCAYYESLLIIHSRCDIAKIIDADGIYLNKNSIDIINAINILGKDKLYGTFENCKNNIELSDFTIAKNKFNSFDNNIFYINNPNSNKKVIFKI